MVVSGQPRRATHRCWGIDGRLLSVHAFCGNAAVHLLPGGIVEWDVANFGDHSRTVAQERPVEEGGNNLPLVVVHVHEQRA